MNLGSESTQQQLKQLNTHRGRGAHHFLVIFLKTILICLIVLLIGACVFGGLYVRRLIRQLPDASEINISPEGYRSTILDSEGNVTETLAASGSNRRYVTIDKIPENVQKAFIDIEDERFYQHNGVDVRGIVRAVFTGISSGGRSMQGASTITQQLLKNNYFTGWTAEAGLRDKIDRKIQEQYLAIQLEKVTDKKTILENYLNTINLGQNTLGVEAASERYFNKPVSDLNLSEAAVIASICQNPSRYNPITHPKENAKRRRNVLNNMLRLQDISQAEYDAAMKDNVYDRIRTLNADGAADDASTSYFEDALTEEVAKDLMEQQGYSEAEAYRALYAGGLTIYSTQDTSIQNVVDEEINNIENYGRNPQYSFTFRLTVDRPDGTKDNYSEQTMLSYYQASNPDYSIVYGSQDEAEAAYETYKQAMIGDNGTVAEAGESITYTLQPQAAMTIMDQSNGHILALSGGRGDKVGSRTLNRASGTTRQPGSTFKILAAYAPALDAAGQTLATVQDDCPTTYENGSSLKNVDNRYRGYTTYREAITDSINIVAVRALTSIGTNLGYDYVKKFGISTLTESDNTQALAIGGLTRGVTNLELTAAYAAIANGGEYLKPVLYTKVVDQDGNVLLDTTKNRSKRVIKKTTAWLLTSAMEDVMARGTGKTAAFEGQAVAGKSGTTNDRRDFIFEGYTPYYTCGIWGGYDDNSEQPNNVYTQRIWHAVMSRIHEGKPARDFTQPSEIVTADVCRKSGELAHEGICDQDPRGDMTYTEYFTKDTVPKELCSRHISTAIDTSTDSRATEFCPAGVVKKGVFIIDGTEETEDAPYAVSSVTLSRVCNVHTAETAQEGTTEEAVPSSPAEDTHNERGM